MKLLWDYLYGNVNSVVYHGQVFANSRKQAIAKVNASFKLNDYLISIQVHQRDIRSVHLSKRWKQPL